MFFFFVCFNSFFNVNKLWFVIIIVLFFIWFCVICIGFGILKWFVCVLFNNFIICKVDFFIFIVILICFCLLKLEFVNVIYKVFCVVVFINLFVYFSWVVCVW